MNANAISSPASFWQRRIIAPIMQQLRQGTTPEAIAFTLAFGFMLSVFPLLGATTLLCSFAGVLLRLNQPIIQLINLLAYPLQLALLIPFYRAGEALLGRPPVPLNIPLLFERFSADFWQFLKDFGMVAVGGILVWLIAAPLFVGAAYSLLRPMLQAAAARIPRSASHAESSSP
jgi:uncharacterized protein (DUF2062 family)